MTDGTAENGARWTATSVLIKRWTVISILSSPHLAVVNISWKLWPFSFYVRTSNIILYAWQLDCLSHFWGNEQAHRMKSSTVNSTVGSRWRRRVEAEISAVPRLYTHISRHLLFLWSLTKLHTVWTFVDVREKPSVSSNKTGARMQNASVWPQPWKLNFCVTTNRYYEVQKQKHSACVEWPKSALMQLTH